MLFYYSCLFLVVAIFADQILSEDSCIKAGRYRYRDPKCKNYFLCVHHEDSLVVRDYVCPPSTIFNPSTNRCSVNAHCIDDICENLPPWVTKIADPNGSDCKTYIECLGSQNTRYPVVKTCEVGYFNKDLLPEPGCGQIPNC